MDTQSLAHTQWNCKYHILFAPKYRRRVIYDKIKSDIGKIIRTLCDYKKVEILEANACPDHIHMLMIFDRHANLKYKYGNRHFWCRGYYVDIVGRNKKAIELYIQKQLQEDIASDQMTLKEYIDPFTGEPVEKNKKK